MLKNHHAARKSDFRMHSAGNRTLTLCKQGQLLTRLLAVVIFALSLTKQIVPHSLKIFIARYFRKSMEIVHTDFKKGLIKLRITDSEDLWYLSHLIEAGDLVTGKTSRKVKLGEQEKGSVAKRIFITKIQAETIDLSEAGNSLRVNGKMKEGPDDLPKDAYQAIELEEGSEFMVEKKQWLAYQKQKLQEAAEKKHHYLLCLFDREEALFALTKAKGYEVLVKMQGEAPKKAKTIEIKKDFLEEIINTLELYATRYAPETIILASPAFYKEDLLRRITNQELKRKIILATCSDISETSLDEVIKSPELEKALKSSRSRQEKLLVDELLKEINKENLAVYGWREVEKAVSTGAVRKLIVTDKYIKQKKTSSSYQQLDELMKQVDSSQGEIHILSSEEESGRKVDGLGGIAALLRYKSWTP